MHVFGLDVLEGKVSSMACVAEAIEAIVDGLERGSTTGGAMFKRVASSSLERREYGEEEEDEWAVLAHSVSAGEVGAGSESAEIRARAEEGGRLRKRNFFTAQVS